MDTQDGWQVEQDGAYHFEVNWAFTMSICQLAYYRVVKNVDWR